jgi:Protein of unknown function (DUF2934)
MTVSATQIDERLRTAYRATFQEYSGKLALLQGLMNSAVPDPCRIEAALLEVEKARVAHNSARDLLARELMRPASPPAIGVDEHRVRETAKLLWEIAGRPDGTAECDWQRAEKLVHAAASSAG